MNKQIIPVNNGLQEQMNEGLFRRIGDTLQSIRERAYLLSQAREGSGDESIEDWLRAERELFQVPESELSETESTYNLRISVRGFEPEQLQVAAEPCAITVHGTAASDVKVLGSYTQRESKALFRRVELPSSIDPVRIKATLEDGVLSIVMPKTLLAHKPIAQMQKVAEQGEARAA